jgi:hypothetical protein
LLRQAALVSAVVVVVVVRVVSAVRAARVPQARALSASSDRTAVPRSPVAPEVQAWWCSNIDRCFHHE